MTLLPHIRTWYAALDILMHEATGSIENDKPKLRGTHQKNDCFTNEWNPSLARLIVKHCARDAFSFRSCCPHHVVYTLNTESRQECPQDGENRCIATRVTEYMY